MGYSFSNLSPADFEDLVRDLIGKELNVRFEAFNAGPDGGMDGRHSQSGKTTVLQAKHYLGSTFTALRAALRKERRSIEKLRPRPRRYILATSQAISPKRKAVLAKTIGPSLKRESDIFGPAELNGLLRKHPEVEKANIKLWLSSTAVLERVLRSAAHAFTAMSRADIQGKVNVYAPNPSFSEALEKLEANHVVIISGPPGVGKTTLAEMLAYAYIGEEWEFEAIRRLDDGFGAIADQKKQIFFFDDFLGQVSLDARALSMRDSELARFIRRIRKAPNARFILTTRAPVFEEARRVSEHLGDPRLNIVKYVLDVGIYTRRIRARILYNHLFVAGTPKKHIKALWESGSIAKIVDHKNYNPRIIEGMTDSLRTHDVVASAYPNAFIQALDHPHDLWDKSFRTHIPAKCRHLLFGLFFCSEYGAALDDLKLVFNALHPAMCRAFNMMHDTKDFEDALRILEGGYVSISGTHVSFVNPSVRDYLTHYLNDADLLALFASTAQKADWAETLWRHIRVVNKQPVAEQVKIANAFKAVAEAFPTLPVMKQDSIDPTRYRFYDSSLAGRIALLLEWCSATGDEYFIDRTLEIAARPQGGFSPWRDAKRLVSLVRDLRTGDDVGLPRAAELAMELEGGLVEMLEGHVWPDDLDRIYALLEQEGEILSGDVFDAANRAVERGVEDAMEDAAAIDSESTLKEHIEALKRLAPRAGIPNDRLSEAISQVESRISEVQESTEEAAAPDFSTKGRRSPDVFDDDELRDLFAPLVAD